jgi:hypothetical protein
MDDYGSVGFGARRVCLRRGTPAELHSASLLDRRRQLQPPPQFTRKNRGLSSRRRGSRTADEGIDDVIHQPPGAGAGVGPRFRQGSELRLGVRDLLDDTEQVEGATGEAVDPRHRHRVAGGEGFEHAERLAPGDPRAGHLLTVILVTACVAELLKLDDEVCPRCWRRA